jgi:hypothetical protein
MYVRSSHDSDPAREPRKRCQDGSIAAGAEAGTALKETRPWWQWHHSDDCSYMIGRCRLLLCIIRTRRTFQRGVPRGLRMRRVLKTGYINLASTQTRTGDAWKNQLVSTHRDARTRAHHKDTDHAEDSEATSDILSLNALPFANHT